MRYGARRIFTLALLAVCAMLVSRAESADKNAPCFCLVSKGLPSAMKREVTHKGCRRVDIPLRHTQGVNCTSDADGSTYQIDFKTAEDFQKIFDEIAEGEARCTPCTPVIKATDGPQIPRGNDGKAR